MKRFLYITLVSFILLGSTFDSSAIAYSSNRTIEYLEDGYYIETIILNDSDFSICATNSKSAKKTVTFYDSADVAQWSITINGTFSYNGSSATCTSASISHTILDSAWKIASETATKSGNKAIGNAQAKRYFLGICTRTIEKSVTLSCSSTGVLS